MKPRLEGGRRWGGREGGKEGDRQRRGGEKHRKNLKESVGFLTTAPATCRKLAAYSPRAREEGEGWQGQRMSKGATARPGLPSGHTGLPNGGLAAQRGGAPHPLSSLWEHWQYLKSFACHSSGCAGGICGQMLMHRTAPTTEHRPAPNGNSAKIDTPCCKAMFFCTKASSGKKQRSFIGFVFVFMQNGNVSIGLFYGLKPYQRKINTASQSLKCLYLTQHVDVSKMEASF